MPDRRRQRGPGNEEQPKGSINEVEESVDLLAGKELHHFCVRASSEVTESCHSADRPLLADWRRAAGGRAAPQAEESATRHVARDYFIAPSEHAGSLWVFQTRRDSEESAGFLHGMFA
ncbi:hypothetical protein AB4Z46_07985 [Variovorax sp. M-6]|uniref:hypothetical protein n=1 Tax=Variovorax sp. M-6 TaxID=3233041 RepID=UPI003F956FDF